VSGVISRAVLLPLALALLVGGPAVGATPAPPGPPLPEAQPIGLHAVAARAKVRLGEPFAYSVEIRHLPEEWYVLAPDPQLSPFRAEGIRCRRDGPAAGGTAAAAEARTTCTMQLALFALGQVDVPDLPFTVERPGGKARLSVPGPRITGVGVIDPAAPPEALQLRDIAPPAPLLVRTLLPLWWALGILCAAALAWAGGAAARRLRPRRGPPPPPSPFQRFSRRLASLEAERLPERGEGAEHVARLSEAVREYLGALAGRPALDLTSAELLEVVRAAGDPRIDPDGLARFLADADLVKFARAPPLPELCQAGLEFAQGLRERTRPTPGPEEAR
jgi:hypothetical protein